MFRSRPQEVVVKKPHWALRALGWVIRKTMWLLWKITSGLLRAKLQILRALLLAWLAGLTGRWRHIVRPITLVALAWIPFPNDWEVYAAAAVTLWIAYGTRGKVRGWSKREVGILATGSSAVALWHPAFAAWGGFEVGFAPIALGVAYLAALGYHAGLWIDGRRVRPAAPPDPLLLEWAEKVTPIPGLTPVVPVDPEVLDGPVRYVPTELGAEFEGEFTEWTSTGEGEAAGVLRLTRSKASDIADKDEDAERALDLRRGGVVISADPRLSVREVRVYIRKDPEAAARQLAFWQGPTLQKDGRFEWQRRRDGSVVYGRKRRPEVGSVIHIGMVAPSRGGKGGAFRIVLLESAIDPLTVNVNIDGKGGGGIPYAKKGAKIHVTEKHLWLPTLEGYHAAMGVRSDRMSVAEQDGWVATPTFPEMDLNVDELPKVHSWGTRKQQNRAKFIVLDVTRTGGSLGYGLRATLQKGDDGGWGDTETRMNAMGEAGQVWLGKVTDVGATNTAFQSLGKELGIDPARLPDGSGWAYVAGKGGGGQAVLEARTLWIPTRFDVEGKGMEAPLGTVEDWMERYAVATEPDPLEWEAFQDAYDRTLREIESAAAVAPPAGVPVAVGAPAGGGDGVPGGALEDPWAVPLGGGLATVTRIPTAAAAPPALRMSPGMVKTLGVLTEARDADERVSARKIAKRTSQHVSTVIQHLDKLTAAGVAEGGPDEGWRAA